MEEKNQYNVLLYICSIEVKLTVISRSANNVNSQSLDGLRRSCPT